MPWPHELVGRCPVACLRSSQAPATSAARRNAARRNARRAPRSLRLLRRRSTRRASRNRPGSNAALGRPGDLRSTSARWCPPGKSSSAFTCRPQQCKHSTRASRARRANCADHSSSSACVTRPALPFVDVERRHESVVEAVARRRRRDDGVAWQLPDSSGGAWPVGVKTIASCGNCLPRWGWVWRAEL